MKYEDMDLETDERGYNFADSTHRIMDEPGECIWCHKPTRTIDVLTEQHICSTECEYHWNRYYKSLLEHAPMGN